MISKNISYKEGVYSNTAIRLGINNTWTSRWYAKNNYANYINSYIAADGNNLGYEKIIKILKERFF